LKKNDVQVPVHVFAQPFLALHLHQTNCDRTPDAPERTQPLVVLHGGPQVPSDYLFDLAKVDYRSVVFFDQMGCGRSACPPPGETAQYSIEASVKDLTTVLSALGVLNRKYHLLGQSWGGILAYEFLRSRPPAQECLSLIISNTPTSVAQVEADVKKQIELLGGESSPAADVAAKFRTTHECRLPERPKLLVDAYAHAGTVWRGTGAIKSWALDPNSAKITQPTLVVRGEHDFVTEASQEQWKTACPRARFKSIAGASHHCLLEKTDAYIEMVDAFLAEYD